MTVHKQDSTTRTRSLALMTAATAIMTSPLAHAHHAMDGATPSNFVEGFVSGLAHPVIGADHFAFLLVAAMLSFAVQGKARYLVPLAFVGATLAGTLYHVAAASLPMAETVVALSALLGGVAVMLKRSASVLLLGSLFAGIGLFHGYAYGESIIGAEQTALLSYLAGFAVIQYAVIAGGIKGMEKLAARSERVQNLAARFGGLFATATGGLFLAMNLA